MNALSIISRQNDSVDAICFRHYGNSSMVEAVLDANPGLASLGALLPIGQSITLPAAKSAELIKKTVKLWD